MIVKSENINRKLKFPKQEFYTEEVKLHLNIVLHFSPALFVKEFRKRKLSRPELFLFLTVREKIALEHKKSLINLLAFLDLYLQNNLQGEKIHHFSESFAVATKEDIFYFLDTKEKTKILSVDKFEARLIHAKLNFLLKKILKVEGIVWQEHKL